MGDTIGWCYSCDDSFGVSGRSAVCAVLGLDLELA